MTWDRTCGHRGAHNDKCATAFARTLRDVARGEQLTLAGFHSVLTILHEGVLALGIRNALIDALEVCDVLLFLEKWRNCFELVFVVASLFGTLELHSMAVFCIMGWERVTHIFNKKYIKI